MAQNYKIKKEEKTMGFLWNVVRFLGAATESGEGKTETPGKTETTELGESLGTGNLQELSNTFTATLTDIMKIVMPIVVSVVLALGVFFCIKLGIAYAKTEKTEDREEAKKRLIGAVIGFGIGIVGAVVMWILFTNQNIVNSLFS